MENTNVIQNNLQKIINYGCSSLHERGNHFFISKFFSPLLILEKKGQSALTFLSKAFYLAGEVFFMNNAIRHAIKAYQKAIFYDENHHEAFQELADLKSTIGEYKEAISLYKSALKLQPDDEECLEELQSAELDLKNDEPPLLTLEMPEILINDLIVDKEYSKAIEVFTDENTTESCLLKARIWGAMNDNKAYLGEWKKISNLQDEFEIDLADWFYLPDEVNSDPHFWRYMLKALSRYKPGFFIHFDSLDEHYTIPEIEKNKIIAEYFIASLEKDKKKQAELHQKYPKCTEFGKYNLDIS